MSENERQVGGEHYKRHGGLQHWDVVHHFDLDYFQGQITKYVMRWRLKGGVQDLKKAAHFLAKYIELQGKAEEATQPVTPVTVTGLPIEATSEPEQMEAFYRYHNWLIEGYTLYTVHLRCPTCRIKFDNTQIGLLPKHECGVEPAPLGYVDQDRG